MKKIYLGVLLGVPIIAIIVLMGRFLSKQSYQNSSADLNALKRFADSGASIKQLLDKAAQFDYVLSALKDVSPDGIKVEPDNLSSWDQTASLTEINISKIGRTQKGEIQLRRRAGGFFLALRIADGKISSSETTFPPAE